MYSVSFCAASTSTATPATFGFQDSTAPVEPFTAAMFERVCPPSPESPPPTNTVVPCTSMQLMAPDTSQLQPATGAPVLVSTCASPVCAAPATVLKLPPTSSRFW